MEPIKSALTSEEWASVLKTACIDCYTFDKKIPVSEFVEPEDISRHALAALCLHGQPFGFRREDVALLRNASDDYRDGENHLWPIGVALLSLADRIEALLPPEGTS